MIISVILYAFLGGLFLSTGTRTGHLIFDFMQNVELQNKVVAAWTLPPDQYRQAFDESPPIITHILTTVKRFFKLTIGQLFKLFKIFKPKHENQNSETMCPYKMEPENEHN